MPRPRPILDSQAEVSLVEHLDELRHRLLVCIAAFVTALALCFWQNGALLEIARAPLPAGHEKLLTLGVTEPFTTTMTVAAYGAVALTLPVLFYEAYAFIAPAFGVAGRRLARLLMLTAPLLFVAGATFAYFLVLPAAVGFLLNFNASQFNVQPRAREYYSFFGTTVLACGVVFQLPLAIVAVTRLGLITIEQLRANRRYAYLVIAIVAAALPGVDPISMILETLPLVALFELSLALARAFAPRGSAQPLSEPGG